MPFDEDYNENRFDDEENEPQKKKKRFRLFDMTRDGKGVRKEDIYTKHDLKGFFISLKLHFSQLVSVNLISIICNFPVFFALAGLSGLFQFEYTTPRNPLYANFAGLVLNDAGASGLTAALRGLLSTEIAASAMTLGSYILLGLSLLTAFTFGIVNTGTTYLNREMVRGNPVFMLEDFIYAIRRNFKQGFFFGIFDFLMLLVIPFNLVFFAGQETIFMSIGFWTMLVLSIFYIFMRFYVYLQIVSFDLSIVKILKNAMIFAILNAKRNILALLGIVLLVVFTASCFITALTTTLGIAILLFILFALGSYIAMYAAFFKVEEIMVGDPSANAESGVALPESDGADPSAE